MERVWIAGQVFECQTDEWKHQLHPRVRDTVMHSVAALTPSFWPLDAQAKVSSLFVIFCLT